MICFSKQKKSVYKFLPNKETGEIIFFLTKGNFHLILLGVILLFQGLIYVLCKFFETNS